MLILSSSLEAFAITMKICKLWVLVSIVFSLIGATPSHCGAATAEPATSVPGAIDNQSAYMLALAAAQAGNADAQYRVGVSSRDGHGTLRDSKAAAKWFASAAEQNHSAAMTDLAMLYQSGDGVGRDRERAAELLTKAAELGNADAQFKLAQAYQAGIGVMKNLIHARYWYESADALQAEAERPKGQAATPRTGQFPKALADNCKPRLPRQRYKHTFRPIEVTGTISAYIDNEGRVRGVRALNISEEAQKYYVVAMFSDSLRAPECVLPADVRDLRFYIPFRVVLH